MLWSGRGEKSTVSGFDQRKKDIPMQTMATKTDAQLKNDVLAELKYEPSVKITDIGVLVKDGSVTLNGYATSYGEKWHAVTAAKRVAGVKAIADDIEVKMTGSFMRTDGDIAANVATHLDNCTLVPTGSVKTLVAHGRVTLEGEMQWYYQKNAAEIAVKYLPGVLSVTNSITLKPAPAVSDIGAAIKAAFERNSQLDAKAITVSVAGNKVTLTGIVRNYAEKDEANRVAWAASGVYNVDNQLDVEWSWN
jgi:osmotically-inducible protein OsmY